MISIINQIFEIQKKAKDQKLDFFDRNLDRIMFELEEMGYEILNPSGQVYDERDTTMEVSIIGAPSTPRITKVLKPIIYQKDGAERILIQKGIVIAE